MDKEKAQAYEIVGNIACKMFLVFVLGIGWFIVLICWLCNPNLYTGIGAAGGPFAMMIVLGRHFFPKKGK